MGILLHPDDDTQGAPQTRLSLALQISCDTERHEDIVPQREQHLLLVSLVKADLLLQDYLNSLSITKNGERKKIQS